MAADCRFAGPARAVSALAAALPGKMRDYPAFF